MGIEKDFIKPMEVDLNELEKINTIVEEERKELKEEIEKELGKINLNSSSQLAKMFLERYDYEFPKTKTGRAMVNTQSLLESNIPIAEKIIQLRSLNKLLQTGKRIKDLIKEDKLAPEYHLSEEGIIFSKDPALSSILVNYRKIFHRKGKTLVTYKMNYGGLYALILGAGDEELKNLYQQDPEILMKHIYEVIKNDIGIELSELNFEKIITRIIEGSTGNSLEKLGIENGEEFVKKFWERFSILNDFIEKEIEKVKERNGIVFTLTGSVIQLLDISNDVFLRKEILKIKSTLSAKVYLSRVAYLLSKKVDLFLVNGTYFIVATDNIENIKEDVNSAFRLAGDYDFSWRVGQGSNWLDSSLGIEKENINEIVD